MSDQQHDYIDNRHDVIPMEHDIRFVKYQGCGNDFIIVDEMEKKTTSDRQRSKIAQRLCDRHFQVGADGVIFLERAERVHGSMRLFEPAGNEADMCGNGLRCVAAYLMEKLGKKKVDVLTRDGVKTVVRQGRQLKADMGRVRTSRKDLREYVADRGDPNDSMLKSELDYHGEALTCAILNSGEPHIVLMTDDVEHEDVVSYGEAANRDKKRFPAGVNVNLAEVTGAHAISVRTYERGVYGETLACGTGVTACSIAVSLLGLVKGRTVTVKTKGGVMKIDIDDSGRAFMTGPATRVFEGRIRVKV